ncbi:GM16551 [Drosophila sechellia]|uniref:GM16551 n=1 Tax=Drosophila sechellia TaxID=7238 RepID=B4IQJ6_DROSE|nr:GM16551 [Drosophila sechellia]
MLHAVILSLSRQLLHLKTERILHMRAKLRAHVFLIQSATQQAKRVSFCNWFNCTPKTLCTEILVEPWQFVYCSLVSTSENKLLVLLLLLANYARHQHIWTDCWVRRPIKCDPLSSQYNLVPNPVPIDAADARNS